MHLRTILSSFHFIIPAFLFVACDHPVDILDIESESELVIYAFPTTDDEYLVTVSVSRPTAGRVGTLDDVAVECSTIAATGSGEVRTDEVTFVHEETHFGIPMVIYRVKGEHHSGDKINVRVKASSSGKKHEATASTIIPSATPMDVTSVDTINVDGVKLRFLLDVALPANGEGYYATRLTSVWDDPYYDDSEDADRVDFGNVYYESYWQYPSSTHYEHLGVDPSFEPLLNHYSDLNLDPWNDYYKKLYFFSSDDVRASFLSSFGGAGGGQNGGKGGGVLHLQSDAPNRCDYIDVQFYTLSSEYYLMLRHLNDQLSNELADSGLSQTNSTYSNVRGGFGCVAAYACTHYHYTPPTYEGDNVYYGAE